MTRRTSGFTLLEVLIAMALLTVGIFAAAQLFPAALRQSQIAHERTVASELADDRLGTARSVGARQIQDLMDARFLTLNALDMTNVAYNAYSAVPPVVRSFSANAQRLDDYTGVDLQRVTLTVELPEGRRESYVTYVTSF